MSAALIAVPKSSLAVAAAVIKKSGSSSSFGDNLSRLVKIVPRDIKSGGEIGVERMQLTNYDMSALMEVGKCQQQLWEKVFESC